MKIDFFRAECQEIPRNDLEFGINDGINNSLSYTTIDKSIHWIAKVQNPKTVSATFVAIDGCIIDSEFKRCDGMLFTSNGIYFIELKEKRKSVISEAIEQLETTIQLFLQNHKSVQFKTKKAHICNKKGIRFNYSNKEILKKFYDTYKYRIDFKSEIKIS